MECSEVVKWKNFEQIGRFDKDDIKDPELKGSEDAEVIMDFEWVPYLTVFVSVIQ